MAEKAVSELRIAGPARRDIATIHRWSIEHFGEAAALRYQGLIAQAIRDLMVDPARAGTMKRPDLKMQGARTYHLSCSRSHVTGNRVKEPRHFIVYRAHGGILEISRILHDSRDLDRHLPRASEIED